MSPTAQSSLPPTQPSPVSTLTSASTSIPDSLKLPRKLYLLTLNKDMRKKLMQKYESKPPLPEGSSSPTQPGPSTQSPSPPTTMTYQSSQPTLSKVLRTLGTLREQSSITMPMQRPPTAQSSNSTTHSPKPSQRPVSKQAQCRLAQSSSKTSQLPLSTRSSNQTLQPQLGQSSPPCTLLHDKSSKVEKPKPMPVSVLAAKTRKRKTTKILP